MGSDVTFLSQQQSARGAPREDSEIAFPEYDASTVPMNTGITKKSKSLDAGRDAPEHTDELI